MGFDWVGVLGLELAFASKNMKQPFSFVELLNIFWAYGILLGRILVREFGDCGTEAATGCSSIGGGVDGALGAGLCEWVGRTTQ
jgi:hypothetical protein